MNADEIFVFGNAGWPALLLDSSGTILSSNPAASETFALTGSGPVPLASLWPVDSPLSSRDFLAQWERSPSSRISLKLKTVKGNLADFPVSICIFQREGLKFFLLQVLPEAVPATNGKSGSEFNLAQKQKLDCALQLARTVSLDFNNALTGILGHTSLLLSQVSPDHPWRHSLVEVEKSAHRAAETANDLAAFSRVDSAPRGPGAGNLNTVVQSAVALLQNSCGGKAEWRLEPGRQLFAVRFDEAKMQQALVKLLENAFESLTGPGRITIQTRNLELTEDAQDRNLRLATGNYVCVEISDTGCGIPPDLMPRVFEPFFTTKQRGNHRGLGLALVYGIITNHAGGVAISSQPGGGTSVRVYLPAEKTFARESTPRTDNLKGHETVLIVDDEELLLTMGRTVLTAYGYRVLTAASGQKALEIISQEQTPPDLLLTDLVMPSMSGRELADEVCKLSPSIRVICMSGFVRPMGQGENIGFLQKPFTSQDLLSAVKQALTPVPAHRWWDS